MDDGLVWSPRLKAPKHGASVYPLVNGGWMVTCPACDMNPTFGDHDSAMVASLNHRSEYR